MDGIDHTAGEAMVVLVIDDSPDDVEFLHMAAEQVTRPLWFQVTESTDEALVRIGQLTDILVRPAAVILDWSLPGLGSRTVLDALRSTPEWDALPVVVYSGSDDPEDMARARAMGASAFEVKPASLDGVAAMLERVIGLTEA